MYFMESNASHPLDASFTKHLLLMRRFDTDQTIIGCNVELSVEYIADPSKVWDTYTAFISGIIPSNTVRAGRRRRALLSMCGFNNKYKIWRWEFVQNLKPSQLDRDLTIDSSETLQALH